MGSLLTLSCTPLPVSASTAQADRSRLRRRHISPQAGHALEKLGHAIEYLTDEFIREGGSLAADNAQVRAVQLLMGINRQIYFACPEVPSLGERLRGLLHLRAA